MATIAENLQKIIDFKAAIKTALEAQGVEAGDSMESYAGLISDVHDKAVEEVKNEYSNGRVWTQSNITSGNWNAPVYANGLWVTECTNLGIYYSTDGMTWTQSNITSGKWDTPVYANGLWVIGSNNMGIYYSTDGMTWTQSNITSGNWNTPVYANGLWVIGSNNMGIYYSTDGMTWTQSNITSGQCPISIYANGIIIAIVDMASLYYSTDGMTWTACSHSYIGASYFRSPIIYHDGVFVVSTDECSGTGAFYSSDGINWTQTNKVTGGTLKLINNVWYILDGYNGYSYRSTNGMTWNMMGTTLNDIVYGDGIWIGDTGAGVVRSITGDGNWEYSELSGIIGCVNNMLFIFNRYDGVFYSTDGITWTRCNLPYSNGVLFTNNHKISIVSLYGSGIHYSKITY